MKGRWTVQQMAVADTDAWIRACANTDLVWLESPSNPLLDVADLVTLCAAKRKSGGILAVDNTFATPLNQRPLALGADVSMQSATKFIGGHSDLLAGVVTVRSATLRAALMHARELGGATPGTLEAFSGGSRRPHVGPSAGARAEERDDARHSIGRPRSGDDNAVPWSVNAPDARNRTSSAQRLRYDYFV